MARSVHHTDLSDPTIFLKDLRLLIDVTTARAPSVRLSSIGEKSDGQEIRQREKDISRDMTIPADNEQNSQNQKGKEIKVFISHRWAEGEHEFASELRKKLMDYGDITPLLDEYEMLPGDNIEEWMDKTIQRGCDVFLFLMSPGSLSSQTCLRELDTARQTGLPIIPILVRDCEIPVDLRKILGMVHFLPELR